MEDHLLRSEARIDIDIDDDDDDADVVGEARRGQGRPVYNAWDCTPRKSPCKNLLVDPGTIVNEFLSAEIKRALVFDLQIFLNSDEFVFKV